jgi:two-component system OmpR family response regulator
METSSHLLLIEDDAEIGRMVCRFMQEHGFRISLATNGKAVDRIMADNKIDLVLLDLMLPGEDGLSICRRLRTVSTVPIIIITALGAEADRVVGLEVGLEVGADDYVPKPFSTRELLARVRAVLRRSRLFSIADRQTAEFGFAGWRLSLGTRQLRSPDGSQVTLTSSEFNVLSVFCQHPGRVLTREQLLDLAHGRSAVPFDRSVDILISRLRRKIEPDPKDPTLILTVRNGGYMFTPEVSAFGDMQ